MKKITDVLIATIIIVAVIACNVYVFHDYQNPCYTLRDRADSIECTTWQKKYPHEFARFKYRLKKDSVLRLRQTQPKAQ